MSSYLVADIINFHLMIFFISELKFSTFTRLIASLKKPFTWHNICLLLHHGIIASVNQPILKGILLSKCNSSAETDQLCLSQHLNQMRIWSSYLDSCYLFTKKMLNIELNIILIVLLEFAYFKTFLIFTADSMNTLQFKQMMNSTVC